MPNTPDCKIHHNLPCVNIAHHTTAKWHHTPKIVTIKCDYTRLITQINIAKNKPHTKLEKEITPK